jgi:hypothetical protein
MNAEMHLQLMKRTIVWGARLRLGLALACAAALPSCSQAIRSGQSPAFLVLNSLAASRGNGGTFTSNLLSDVVTVVDGVPTVFNDLGQATIAVQMKDLGGLAPTAANAITITQYHVKFFRTDGRNTEGVDVPYAFDGAVTATIQAGGSSAVGFTLVRNQAKLEAPLRALAQNFQVISTIAEVTLYGHDQNGREVSVTGRMDVAFANFGD